MTHPRSHGLSGPESRAWNPRLNGHHLQPRTAPYRQVSPGSEVIMTSYPLYVPRSPGRSRARAPKARAGPTQPTLPATGEAMRSVDIVLCLWLLI